MEWIRLQHGLYKKVPPPQIKNIKNRQVHLWPWRAHRLSPGRWVCARCLGPYMHHLVSAPNHPEAGAEVTCSRVAVTCGKRLDPRKHMLHCGQRATGTQGCAACPRALCHSGDHVSKEQRPCHDGSRGRTTTTTMKPALTFKSQFWQSECQ